MTNLYPEHTKLKLEQHKSQIIHEFIEWLNREKGISLGEYLPNSEHFYPIMNNTTNLVANFLDIDLAKLENEKREMIELIRNKQK